MHERWSEIYDWAGVNVRDLVNAHFDTTARILDVGAGQGKYRILLGRYPHVDGCEIHEKTALDEDLANVYRRVFICDVCDLLTRVGQPDDDDPEDLRLCYDLFIFGDVLEHLDVPSARDVVNATLEVAEDVIVVVPYLYPQEPHDGNEHQRHIQDDLTPEVMVERYPNLRLVMMESRGGEPFKGIYRGR